MLGSCFHLPLLFGFPEFLRLFPRKLSQLPLSTSRCQRSVLVVAWDDVTSAGAPGLLPGNEASSRIHSGPPPLPPSSDPAPCHLFPLSFPLALVSSRWETLAWSFVRGRGMGVVWWKDYVQPFAGLRELWVTFP